MGRRKSTLEDLFDMLFDATGMFWQVGAVVSAIMAILAIWSFFWIQSLINTQAGSTSLGAIVESLSWLYYSLPLILGLIALLFGWKTYQVYLKQQRY
ncbi:MAG: hypothetical protein RPU43_03075 [Candidatus Sedimenticola sp. (ex Thyasira tokunagai)]